MRNSGIIHRAVGLFFITIGVIFYLTPVPGTTILVTSGLVLLIGGKRTTFILREILGKKLFRSLKINRLIKAEENLEKNKK